MAHMHGLHRVGVDDLLVRLALLVGVGPLVDELHLLENRRFARLPRAEEQHLTALSVTTTRCAAYISFLRSQQGSRAGHTHLICMRSFLSWASMASFCPLATESSLEPARVSCCGPPGRRTSTSHSAGGGRRRGRKKERIQFARTARLCSDDLFQLSSVRAVTGPAARGVDPPRVPAAHTRPPQ